jgi:hypothetical protein
MVRTARIERKIMTLAPRTSCTASTFPNDLSVSKWLTVHSRLSIQAVFHLRMVAAGGENSKMIVAVRKHRDLRVYNSLETVQGTAVLPPKGNEE